jgi:hypothetical protein
MQDNIGRAQDRYESRRQREAEDSLQDEQDYDYEDWSDEDEFYGCDETEA